MNVLEHKKLQNIVLAVDGSEDAWAAVDMLRDLPLTASATIHTLSALLPREASMKAWALMAVLERAQEQLERTGAHVETRLLTGNPAEEVMAYCDEHQPDLIMLGATGLRATLGILLGGVAQQIVEYACCPVLVVRRPYSGLQRVLLVVDGSRHSEGALEFISRYPLPATTDIRVLHVLPPIDANELVEQIRWPGATEPVPEFATEAEQAVLLKAEEEQQGGEALLARTLETFREIRRTARSELVRGDAATEIIQYIRGNAIDLVVAGSRGLSPVEGWLLGSVSRKLVHYAGCSVMIVKQPETGRA